MRLTTVLLMASLIQVSASTLAQKITLSEKNVPLVKVFEQIRAQSGFDFMFNSAALKDAKQVSIAVKNEELKQVLDKIFDSQPLTYEIAGKSVIVSKREPSLFDKIGSVIQNIVRDLTVKGRVTDQDGKPLPNASIRVKRGIAVTNTNQNGEFEIKNVNEDAVLLVSYVGYKTLEIPVKGAVMPLEIKLNVQTGELEEVNIASTGYQKIKPNEINGSVVLIDNKKLNQQFGTNILQRLDGITNGLLFTIGKNNPNPQNKTNITIRGLSTINGPLDPLIVLDGFIYEGDIENINPNIIENITILKYAAAASIWGARAGNGVIVITTKTGKFNEKLKVDFSANMIVKDKPNLYDLPQMSSADIIDVEQFLFDKGFFNNRINQKFTSLTPAVEVFLKKRDKLISKGDSAARINALKMVDTRDEYEQYVYKKGISQQYNLNVRGGSNNNAFSLSAGYDQSNNELHERGKKLNLRIENNYKPIKNLNINIGAYYTNSKLNSGIPSYGSIQTANRNVTYFRLADENGLPLSVSTQYRDSYIDTAGAGKLLNWKFYPLEDYKHKTRTSNTQELYATTGLQYRITSYLDIDLKYQYQDQITNNVDLRDLQSYATRDYINQFSQLNRNTGIVKYIVPLGGIRGLSESKVRSNTVRGQLNFDKSWNIHKINFLLGGEARQNTIEGNQSLIYGYNEDPLTNITVDLINPYPHFITGQMANINGAGTALTSTINKFVSFYTNAAYNYKKRYYLSGSARSDGSNIFGAKTNDKWKPLWSVGLGWDVSKEAFYKLDLVPYLKLKGTYGSSGNVDLSKTALPIARYLGSSPPLNLPYANIREINNPDLRWEQSVQTNIGIDFALERGIISGTIEYYHKKGTDLYGITPYDYTTWGGASSITRNVADMSGRGIDIQLQLKNIDGILKWSSTLIFNYSTSKTTKYFGPQPDNLNAFLGGGNRISPVIGMPLYGIVAYRWAGLDNQGNPQGFLNGEKSINYNAINLEAASKGIEAGTTRYIGNGVPQYFGSVMNAFSYKNFTLNFNITYKFDYFFRKSTINYAGLVDIGTGHKDYERRWQKSGDELSTNVPSFVYPANSARDNFYANSEINVEKADHIRLQFVNLSYSLSKQRSKYIPFDNLTFSVNAANLGILWRANKSGLDPDYSSSIHPVKTWSLGIRGNF